MGCGASKASPVALAPADPTVREAAAPAAASTHATPREFFEGLGEAVNEAIETVAQTLQEAADATADLFASEEPDKTEVRPSGRSERGRVVQMSVSGRIKSFATESERFAAQWEEIGGDKFEPSLSSGAIALLRAEWLIALSEKSDEAQRVISRRQEMPPEAFLSLSELREAVQPEDDELRVIVLSYGWTTPAHPDPLGATLQRVAEVLRHYDGVWAVFWDFASLFQHSPLPGGPRRTEEEQQLFIQGLGASSLYYAHPTTTVFRLTTWPKGYPQLYDLSAGANVAEYNDRGWCFAETCWAALTTNFERSLDLGKFTGTKTRLHGNHGVLAECATGARRPPLLPEQFAHELSSKTFYNRDHDLPLVSDLYAKVFDEQFEHAHDLNLRRMQWDDDAATQLARVVGSGALPNLRRLNVAWNQIGDKGAKKLADALEKVLPPLEKLEYRGNDQMGEPGLQALRRAFSACRDAHSQSGWSEERRNEAAAQIQALKRGQAVRRRSQAGKLGAVSEGSTPGGGRTPGGGKRGATAAGKGSDLAVSTASKSYPPRPVVVAKA